MRLAPVFWLAALAGAPLAAPQVIETGPGLGLEPQGARGEIVESIRVEGLDHTPEQSVISALGLELGEPYDRAKVDEGMHSLWRSFKIIVLNFSQVEREGGGIDVIVRVREQPVDYEPRFVGQEGISTAKILEWADLSERAELYLHEAGRVRHRLITAYRQHGYHFIEIDVITTGGDDDPEGGAPDVIFEIREGLKVRVSSVEVSGNDSLPDTGWGFWKGGLSDLSDRQTKGQGIFSWWGRVFVEEVLRADLVAMRQVYRDRGWLDAKVELLPLVFSDERDRVQVSIIVDEGPQYVVKSIAIQAVERFEDEQGNIVEQDAELFFPEAELLEKVEMKPGVPFEKARLRHDRRAMRDFYGKRGYIAFDGADETKGWQLLEPLIVTDFERKEVLVTYRIHQGRQRFIREIKIRGNHHTRDRVIRREIGVMEGDLADIVEIERSLRRITGTGFFVDRQNPEHPNPAYRFIETDDPDRVDLVYTVEEGRVVDLQLSGGVASDSGLVGIISLSMRNFDATDLPSSFWGTFGEVYRKEAFHGDGELLNIDLSPGSQVSSWRIRYRHPDIFGTHLNRWSLDNEFSQRDRIFRSHDEDRTRAVMTLGRRFFEQDVTVSVGPIYQTVDIHDLDESDDDLAGSKVPDTLEDSKGKSNFRGISFGVRRNLLNSRMSPTEGTLERWNNSIYGGFLGGDNDLIKSEVGYDRYWLMGPEEQEVRPGFFLGLAAGVATSTGQPGSVNYSERFFLGGSSTLRGFRFRGVGPNQGDYAIGGETMLRGTLEYRFPLLSAPLPGTSQRREVFRGLFFIDAGLLDPDAFEVDLDEYRASIGFGFGLVSPIPLTFNFGFPLREGDGDETEVFSFRLSLR